MKKTTAIAALLAGLVLLSGGASNTDAPSEPAGDDTAVVDGGATDTGAGTDADPTFATAEEEMDLGVKLGDLATVAEWTSVTYVNDAGYPKSLTVVAAADAAEAFDAWAKAQNWDGWDTYTTEDGDAYMFTAYGPLGSVVAQQVVGQDTFGVEIFTAE